MPESQANGPVSGLRPGTGFQSGVVFSLSEAPSIHFQLSGELEEPLSQRVYSLLSDA